VQGELITRKHKTFRKLGRGVTANGRQLDCQGGPGQIWVRKGKRTGAKKGLLDALLVNPGKESGGGDWKKGQGGEEKIREKEK